MIHKKGDREDAGNYRPVCGLPILYKLFATVLYARLAPGLHRIQLPDQAGFRPNHRCEDHLMVYRVLEQRCREWGVPLYISTIDFTSTSYPKDTGYCVSARTVHGCTVAFGSGREGGTCWEDQRFLPAHPALQKSGSFCFWGEVRGAHLLSGAEARISYPRVEEKEQEAALLEPEDTSA